MKAIATIVPVTADSKVTMRLPPDIPPGKCQMVLVINEQPVTEKPATKKERPPLNFPVHNCGSWPDDFSLRREDMYDDWGR